MHAHFRMSSAAYETRATAWKKKVLSNIGIGTL